MTKLKKFVCFNILFLKKHFFFQKKKNKGGFWKVELVSTFFFSNGKNKKKLIFFRQYSKKKKHIFFNVCYCLWLIVGKLQKNPKAHSWRHKIIHFGIYIEFQVKSTYYKLLLVLYMKYNHQNHDNRTFPGKQSYCNKLIHKKKKLFKTKYCVCVFFFRQKKIYLKMMRLEKSWDLCQILLETLIKVFFERLMFRVPSRSCTRPESLHQCEVKEKKLWWDPWQVGLPPKFTRFFSLFLRLKSNSKIVKKLFSDQKCFHNKTFGVLQTIYN